MKMKRISAGIAAAIIISCASISLPAEITPCCTVYAAEYTASVTKITSKTAADSTELYWKAVSSAKSYKVEIKEEGGKYKKASCKLSKTTDGRIKATVTGLSPETKYVARVTPKKIQDGKTVYGKAKTAKFTTKTQGFQGTDIKMPDKYCIGLVCLGSENYDGVKAYFYGLDLDGNSDSYYKNAEKNFENYVSYIGWNGYLCEYLTDLEAYKSSEDGTWAYFFKDNVHMASFVMSYSKSYGVVYVLYENQPESVDMNLKGRVPHPDEYDIKCTGRNERILFGNVLTFMYDCSGSKDFDSYIKKLEADGFTCKAFKDSNGLELTDVSFKGNHAGTVSYSEYEGKCSILISYKV